MGYDVYDQRGYVGDLYSANWLIAVSKFLEPQNVPLLQKMLNDTGKIEKSDELLAELDRLEIPDDTDLRKAVSILNGLIRKCQRTVAIWDGVNAFPKLNKARPALLKGKFRKMLESAAENEVKVAKAVNGRLAKPDEPLDIIAPNQ